MKKFKGVILALAMVMGIGMVKPAEAHAIPTETKITSWLRYVNKEKGEFVPIGRWYRPLLYEIDGWMIVANFMKGDIAGAIHPSCLRENHIVTWGVNFRSSAKVTDNIIGRIPKGTKLLVADYGGNGNWAQVLWNGRVGYVSYKYIDPLKRFLPS